MAIKSSSVYETEVFSACCFAQCKLAEGHRDFEQLSLDIRTSSLDTHQI